MTHFGGTESNIISLHYHRNLHISEAGGRQSFTGNISFTHAFLKPVLIGRLLCAKPRERHWRQDRPKRSSHRAELVKGQDNDKTIIAHLISLHDAMGPAAGCTKNSLTRSCSAEIRRVGRCYNVDELEAESRLAQAGGSRLFNFQKCCEPVVKHRHC